MESARWWCKEMSCEINNLLSDATGNKKNEKMITKK